MGRTLTNNTTVAVAKELPGQPGVLPASPVWKQLEPNSIDTLGAEITTVARDPISADRSRRKGTITDLDSSVEYEGDLTMDIIDDFIAGFCYVVATNADLRFTGSDATATGFVVAALTTEQAARLNVGTLVFSQGYATSGNNGLFAITTNASSTDTEIVVSGLAAETADVSAIVEIAGVRAGTGDLALAITGTVGTLTSTTLDFTTLGLTVGQFIHVGGLETANQFTNSVGYARVTAIAANTLTLDKLGSGLVAAAGTADSVDLLFGQFIRNVPTTDPAFIEQPFQFEAQYPNLGTGAEDGQTGFEYAEGNYANTLEFGLPLTDKATATVGFVGTDTKPPVFTAKDGSDTPLKSQKTTALNTSSDLGRLRIKEVDETGLTTDFKELTLTLNNNASPEKVLGQLGARFINTGNFEVDFEAQVLFTEAEVICAIRENRTLSFDMVLINDDGALAVDIPAMTLGGGDKEFPINESILVNLTGQAFRDPTLGTSLSVSLFPAVPESDDEIC